MAPHTLALRDGVVAAILKTFLAHPITGCLTVLGPDRARGRIHIGEGRVVHAETGQLSGLGALTEMLSWRAGTYSLEEGEAPAEHSLSLTLEELLSGVAVPLAPIQSLPSLEALLEERTAVVAVPSYGSEQFAPPEPVDEVLALEQADEAFSEVWAPQVPAPGFFGWVAQVFASIQDALDPRRRAR